MLPATFLISLIILNERKVVPKTTMYVIILNERKVVPKTTMYVIMTSLIF